MRARPTIRPGFFKAHGAGNDYLVFEGGRGPVLTPALVRRICHRWRGPGADGIVVVEERGATDEPRLRMFNPDGGEFERSGNGLRVAGAFLHRQGRVGTEPFWVTVGGDRLRMQIASPGLDGVYGARVEMGTVAFPGGPPFLAEGALVDGTVLLELPGPSGEGPVTLAAVPVSIGNPHAVIFGSAWSRAAVDHLGPLVAANVVFPAGTNVQFVEPPSGRTLVLQIWERGVGRTASSGTSACAALAAAVKLGHLEPGEAVVKMEGGAFGVTVSPDWTVTLSGPVEEVCFGELAPGFLAGSETT